MDDLYDYSIKNKDNELLEIIDYVTDYESIYFDYDFEHNNKELQKIKNKIKFYIDKY